MCKKRDILLLLPSFAGFVVFFVIPFLGSFVYAFTESAFDSSFVGLENFRRLFQSTYFRLAVKNTVQFIFCAVPAAMLLSYITAAAIWHWGGRIPFVRGIFFLPVVLPSAVVVFLWNAYFSSVQPFSSLLLIFLWKYAGLDVVLMLTAFCSLDRDMLEAAKIDGAGKARVMSSIILPNMIPTLFFALILTIVNALKIYRESYLLYGEYPDESVYMLQNYLNNHFSKLNYQNISTAAILFFFAIYTITAILLGAERKWGDSL